MTTNKEILENNRSIYENYYAGDMPHYRFPNEYIIRFHNRFLKSRIPDKGNILDFGYGSGNNSVYMIRQGYEVYGIEVASSSLDLLKKNLGEYNLDAACLKNFTVVDPDWDALPYEDNFFDFILANHVLYYYPGKEKIQDVCLEFSRCLKPGGIVFFTMIGPGSSIVSDKRKTTEKVYRVAGSGRRAPLDGQQIYFVEEEDELTDLFSVFDKTATGYYEESLSYDSEGLFVWIFVGMKKNK